MSSIKKLSAVVLSLLIVFAQSSLISARDIDDGYTGAESASDGYQGVKFREEPNHSETFSWLTVGGKPCEDLNGNCKNYSGNPNFNALLPLCVAPESTYCIETVSYMTTDGKFVAGEFLRNFPTVGLNDFIGDISLGIPSGGPAGIWSFSGVTHPGGREFFVRVGFSGWKNADVVSINSVHASINAVEEIPGPCPTGWIPCSFNSQATQPRIGVLISPDIGIWSQGISDCVMTGDSLCLQRRALPQDSRFSISVRMQKSPMGWLHGRLKDPLLDLKPLTNSSQGYRLIIEGTSLKVPVVATIESFISLPKTIQDVYRENGLFKNGPGSTRDDGCGKCGDPLTRNMTSRPSPSGRNSIEELNLWLPFMKDTASGNLSTWSARSISQQELPQGNRCFELDGTLKGMVTTNATVYSPGPPTFESNNLNYQVAAPHFTSGSDTFLGTYNLVMRSDIARCLYGFSNAPINVTISVVDTAGVVITATKLVRENDGWLRIAAYGFEFSSPIIEVEMTQEKSPSIAVTKKIKTIRCKFKKSIKIVKGTAPKCPKNYRKI